MLLCVFDLDTQVFQPVGRQYVPTLQNTNVPVYAYLCYLQEQLLKFCGLLWDNKKKLKKKLTNFWMIMKAAEADVFILNNICIT